MPTAANAYLLMINQNTNEIFYSGTALNGTGTGLNKTFVIDHPTDKDRYLVHACLEGPEAGVYYRGDGKIVNDKHTDIELPNYVKSLATELTVQITQIYTNDNTNTVQLLTSRVQDNKFTVYGKNCEFFWLVHGKRNAISTEVEKQKVNLKGEGPYKWIC